MMDVGSGPRMMNCHRIMLITPGISVGMMNRKRKVLLSLTDFVLNSSSASRSGATLPEISPQIRNTTTLRMPSQKILSEKISM